jgi:hypothetical protein
LKIRTDNGKKYQGIFSEYLWKHYIQH